MPLKASATPQDKAKAYRKFQRKIPRRIAGTATSFFKDNFRRQGFPQGRGRFDRWPRRKPGTRRDSGRAILVDSGNLKRSVRKQTVRQGYVTVGTDVPYAAIHNQGGRISGQQRVREHTRRTRTGRTTVQAHTRNVDIQMPQRQFMGNSQALNTRLRRMILQELRKVFV